jgi:hypothetical protein
MKINQIARTNMVASLRRLEAAVGNGAKQPELTQLASLFVMEARKYGTAVALGASDLAISATVDEWLMPDDCVAPAACAARGCCLYTPCSAREASV